MSSGSTPKRLGALAYHTLSIVGSIASITGGILDLTVRDGDGLETESDSTSYWRPALLILVGLALPLVIPTVRHWIVQGWEWSTRKVRHIFFHTLCHLAVLALALVGAQAVVLVVATRAVADWGFDPHSLIVASALFACNFWLAVGMMALTAEYRSRVSRYYPRQETDHELLGLVKSEDGKGRDAADLWLEAVQEEQAAVDVCAINADPISEDRSDNQGDRTVLLDAVAGGKKFRILLADPTSRRVRRRSRWIDGDYIQGYVRPFVKKLLEWEVTSRSHTPDLVELRVVDGVPTYRLMLTSKKLVLQRYPSWRVARDEEAEVVEPFSHNHASDPPDYLALAKRFSELIPRSVSELLEWVEKQYKEKLSAFEALKLWFEVMWYGASEPEPFSKWDLDKTEKLAVCCRIKIPKDVTGEERKRVLKSEIIRLLRLEKLYLLTAGEAPAAQGDS